MKTNFIPSKTRLETLAVTLAAEGHMELDRARETVQKIAESMQHLPKCAKHLTE